MARVDFRDCVPFVFAPLIEASKRYDLAEKLKLRPPDKSIMGEQFRRFSRLRKPQGQAVPLPNGGFFLRFQLEEAVCIAFSSYVDELDSDERLANWMRENEAGIESVDQALFLFLARFASPLYNIRPNFKHSQAARDILEIVDSSSYDGHDADDLISVFRPVYLITLPMDSILVDADDFTLCSEVCSLVSDLRSPIIDQDFAGKVHKLLGNHLISSEAVYLVLTATRWRYAFLEMFRILETTLHVPWMLDIKSSLSIDASVPDLYRALRSKLSWREAKGTSVERQFGDLDEINSLLSMERSVKQFSSIDFDSYDHSRSRVGKRIWKIRNQLVHPEDFTDSSKLNVTEDEFRQLCNYLVAVIEKIFERLPHGSLKAQHSE